MGYDALLEPLLAMRDEEIRARDAATRDHQAALARINLANNRIGSIETLLSSFPDAALDPMPRAEANGRALAHVLAPPRRRPMLRDAVLLVMNTEPGADWPLSEITSRMLEREWVTGKKRNATESLRATLRKMVSGGSVELAPGTVSTYRLPLGQVSDNPLDPMYLDPAYQEVSAT